MHEDSVGGVAETQVTELNIAPDRLRNGLFRFLLRLLRLVKQRENAFRGRQSRLQTVQVRGNLAYRIAVHPLVLEQRRNAAEAHGAVQDIRRAHAANENVGNVVKECRGRVDHVGEVLRPPAGLIKFPVFALKVFQRVVLKAERLDHVGAAENLLYHGVQFPDVFPLLAV